MQKLVTLCGVVGLLLLTLPGGAQEIRPYDFQYNLDFRSLLGSNKQRATVYSNELAFNARLGRGWKFLYEGGQNFARDLTVKGGRISRFVTQEAALEQVTNSGNRLQVGLVRLPFGLYDSRETYASGLIDYPLMRGDYALQSVNWGVPGVRWSGGNSRFQADLSLFSGQSTGVWNNLNNTEGVAGRLQFYHKDLIFGISHWAGSQSSSLEHPGPQGTHITGLDFRYTRPHLVLRGEFMQGTLAGEKATGWYIDAYYHLPKHQRVSLVARWEQFRPEGDSGLTKQLTLGMRYTLDSSWIFAVNWRRNNGENYAPTWTPATGKSGDFFFQVYRKFLF